jgi:hypothetical protein
MTSEEWGNCYGYKEWVHSIVYDEDGHYHNIPHRLDGPAKEWPDGRKEYIINGHFFKKEAIDWCIDHNIKDWPIKDEELNTEFKLRFL